MDPRNQSPFNALPPVVVALAGLIMAIELLFQAGAAGFIGGREAVGWRLTAQQDWSVAEVIWVWMIDNRSFPPEHLGRFLGYPLIHGSFVHAAFAAVFILAFGNIVARVYRNWRFLLIFFGASIDGALAYLILFDAPAPLYGGFPGAYGLVAAFAYLTQRGMTSADPSRGLVLLGFLIAIQPVFGLLTFQGFGWVPAWIAEISGAATGYAIAALLFPGNIGDFRDRMRQR